MALTNNGKVLAMGGIASASRWVSLHQANGTELSGNGYARKEITSANMTVGTNGVITVPQLDVYTATTGPPTAVKASQVGLYDAATAGNLLFDLETIANVDDVAAPIANQTVRITLTINP